jgi:hypothetical protein
MLVIYYTNIWPKCFMKSKNLLETQLHSQRHLDRSGEIWSRIEVIYRLRPDVSTGLDMTKESNRLKCCEYRGLCIDRVAVTDSQEY